MARAPIARPTDAPPIAHVSDPGAAVRLGEAERAVDTLVAPEDLPRHVAEVDRVGAATEQEVLEV